MKKIDLLKYGFTRCEERDVEDDGVIYERWYYKGILPLTYGYLEDSYYGYHCLLIRMDYFLKLKDYIDDYKVIDEFNGVKAVDMEKLLSNCEYIFNKYNKALHKYDEE